MLVNTHKAKTHFSKYITRASKGENIIIARAGKPIARLVSYVEELQERRGGQFKGLMNISDDFDAPLPEDMLKQFYED